MEYLNQFHKESEQRKIKKIQESKNFPTTYEEVMWKQKIREQQIVQGNISAAERRKRNQE